MIIFVSPSIMMIFIYISWQLRQKHRKQQEVAPIDVVSRLSIKQFLTEKLKENEAEECAICLEDYVNGEELRVLPCKHDFHTFCVDAWLTTQKKFVSFSPNVFVYLLSKYQPYLLLVLVSHLQTRYHFYN